MSYRKQESNAWIAVVAVIIGLLLAAGIGTGVALLLQKRPDLLRASPKTTPDPKAAEFKSRMVAFVTETRALCRAMQNRPELKDFARHRDLVVDAFNHIPDPPRTNRSFEKSYLDAKQIHIDVDALKLQLELANKGLYQFGLKDQYNATMENFKKTAAQWLQTLNEIESANQ